MVAKTDCVLLLTAMLFALEFAPMRFHLLLPAFNEEAALPRLLERLAVWQATGGHSVRVWIVDDGSEDETYKVATRGHPI